MERDYVSEHACGVKVGDQVEIVGWRNTKPPSRDTRRVIAMWKDRCEGGYMIRLHRPLRYGSTEVTLAWTRQYKDWKRRQR